MIEKTLVLIKPDGVSRNLIGKIISRFEDTGLKIIGMKMIQADDEIAKRHYPLDEEWAKNVFEKTKKGYEAQGKELEYKNYLELGRELQSWLCDFLKECPVVAVVFEGPHAIELVRKITGVTEPRQALPGTIRGDFSSIESYTLANDKKRVVRNLIHASDSRETAEKEISIWFKPEELHNYQKEIEKYF